MSVIQRASFERRRRIQKREDLDAPFYISDEEAKKIAKDTARLSRDPDNLGWKALYQQMLDGEAMLYDFKVVVRGSNGL